MLTPQDKLPLWLHWIDSCPSTNTWAKENSDRLNHGDVIFTRHQTAGRGQQGRIWYSSPGVLTASFILDLPIIQLSGLSLVAGLAVIYAVEELIYLPDILRLKWTNDVLFEQRKLAGILCETSFNQSDTETRVIVGIGLNRRLEIGEIIDISNAVSLYQISCVPDEFALLERLRHHLLKVTDILTQSGLTVFLEELGDRDALLNQQVILELPGETVRGQAIGIDNRGRLKLRFSDNKVCAYSSGRVRLEKQLS